MRHCFGVINVGYKQEQIDYKNRKRRRSKNEYRCSTCGHTIYIHPSQDKALCVYCNRYLERNEKYNIEYISRMEFLKLRYFNFQRKLAGKKNEQISQ